MYFYIQRNKKKIKICHLTNPIDKYLNGKKIDITINVNNCYDLTDDQITYLNDFIEDIYHKCHDSIEFQLESSYLDRIPLTLKTYNAYNYIYKKFNYDIIKTIYEDYILNDWPDLSDYDTPVNKYFFKICKKIIRADADLPIDKVIVFLCKFFIKENKNRLNELIISYISDNIDKFKDLITGIEDWEFIFFMKYYDVYVTLYENGIVDKVIVPNIHEMLNPYSSKNEDSIKIIDSKYLMKLYESVYPNIIIPSRYFNYVKNNFDLLIELFNKFPDAIPKKYRIVSGFISDNDGHIKLLHYLLDQGQTKFVYDEIIESLLDSFDNRYADILKKCFSVGLLKFSRGYLWCPSHHYYMQHRLKYLSKVLDLLDIIRPNYDPISFIRDSDLKTHKQATRLRNYFVLVRGKTITENSFSSYLGLGEYFEDSIVYFDADTIASGDCDYMVEYPADYEYDDILLKQYKHDVDDIDESE